MKNIFILILLLGFVLPSITLAKSLSKENIDRLKNIKQSLVDIDGKTLQQTINEVEKSKHPEIQLSIKEAMAKTYIEIVQEQNVQGLSKRKWLYSMVALNMAYLQFGGDKDSAGNASNLNKLIRSKLRSHLPSGIMQQPGFRTSLE